jgi:hypothetical protein
MPEESCIWTENEDGYWDTDCGETFVVIDATPEANRMLYCCYCGKPLVQKTFEENENEDDTER